MQLATTSRLPVGATRRPRVAFDVDFVLGFALARVGRTLLSDALDLDFGASPEPWPSFCFWPRSYW